MRSARPKPLHMICGRAMVLHVIHALEQLRPQRTALVVGHGAEIVTKKVQEQAPAWANVVFVEQAEQRGTGDAAAHGIVGVPRRRPRRRVDDRRPARRHAAAAARDARPARRHARRQRQRGDAADERARRPDGLRPGDQGARRAGAADRRAARRQPGRAGGARGRHEHLRVPARPARPGAAAPVARQRPGRVLPHRRRRRARRHGPPRRAGRGAGRGDPGRQRPLAAGPGRARAAVAHEPPLAAQRRHDARSPPDVHRRHREARPRRHAVPGDAPRGQHRRRRRVRDRARHPPRRLRRRPRLPRAAHRRAWRPRSATAPGSGRSPTCRPGRTSPRAP